MGRQDEGLWITWTPGDKDDSLFLKTTGAAWHADPYLLSSGPESLFTVFGGEHGLGGIAGYEVLVPLG